MPKARSRLDPDTNLLLRPENRSKFESGSQIRIQGFGPKAHNGTFWLVETLGLRDTHLRKINTPILWKIICTRH